MIDLLFRSEGLKVLGYREVPVNKEVLAQHVAKTHMSIKSLSTFTNHQDIEKKLYLARKQIEHEAEQQGLELYFTSLSHKTIVYKGWLRSDQIKGYIWIYNIQIISLNLDWYILVLARIHSQVGNGHIS